MKLSDLVRKDTKHLRRNLRGELKHERKKNNPADVPELKKMSDGETDNGYSKI